MLMAHVKATGLWYSSPALGSPSGTWGGLGVGGGGLGTALGDLRWGGRLGVALRDLRWGGGLGIALGHLGWGGGLHIGCRLGMVTGLLRLVGIGCLVLKGHIPLEDDVRLAAAT